MYDWLTDAVADGGVVATANRRLARELRAGFDREQLARGRKSWVSPRIRAWSDWLDDLLDSVPDSTGLPLRIDQHSATVLWERCLKEHLDGRVLNFAGLVRQAMQAWQRLNDWQVPARELSGSARSRDQDLFVAAARSYRKILRTNQWVDGAGLPALVIDLLGQRALSPPRKVTVAGFERMTPAVESVLTALREAGGTLSLAPTGEVSSRIAVVSHADAAAELRAAGNWVREVLMERPAARLAVVSADLDKDAGGITRLVREGFAPGWQYGGAAYESAVSVSFGGRLAEYPLIAVALRALQWTAEGLDSRNVSLLMRSDFVGGPVTAGRTALELELRRLPDRQWMPGDLHRILARADDEADRTRWWASVKALAGMHALSGQERAPDEWAARIDTLLDELGWPGIDRPDSMEFQLLNRWRELLNELARTGVVQSRMTLADAVRRLRGMAGEAIYQPESEVGMLQLLGPLEVIGLEFDAVWLSGMDASRWPLHGHPSALISRSLQRRLEMPDSTPADTLAYSRRVLRRLVSSADEIVVSWSHSEKETQLDLSPLLAEFDTLQDAEHADPDWHATSFLGTGLVAECDYDPVPRIGDKETVAGGAYTVQRQYTEPFSAFAAGRLRIAEIPAFESGITASLRGSIVHHALHTLYRDCPSISDLRSWGPQEIERRSGRAADAAVAPHLGTADATQRRLLDFERMRTKKLLGAFLDAEDGRAEFTVAAVEQGIEFERHGVRLQLRVDRVDRLADGSALIIDYKSGAARSLLTRDGRPADLQLVVYSCAIDERIGGLALVNIDSREITYKAAGGSAEWDKSDAAGWTDRIADWQNIVDQALQQLAAGDVRLNLRLPAQEGRALGLLSRIEELRREQ
jgi:probable DNA repair protein